VEDRLLAALWHFADRWGVEEIDGVAVPLTVSHEVLAQLVSAQRPTVSAAMQRLQEAGQVRRLADRSGQLLRTPADLRPKATAAA
jgi:CRP-like cAMP-binding protein